ncbi:MAG: alpha-galactosidase, partial [Clostridia bacterium]|nr:alpha-galactosidase [Clostridia bacterium]
KKEYLLSLSDRNPVKLVNFGNDEAREYMENLVFGLVEDFKLDIFRQDFNMDPLAYWRAYDEDCRTGITEIKHINGLYLFWDHLLERFPNIWIDNTAGGGRRIDIETLRRAAFPWRSDTNCFYQYAYPHDQRRRTSWNHNQLLGFCEYIPYHGGGSWSEKAYDIRSTASHGVNCSFNVYNPDFDWEAGKKIVAEVKEMSEYWDGDFYPLTKAALGEHVWAAYQLVLEDKGALYAFRPEQCFKENETIAFKALDENADYKLTFIDDDFNRTCSQHSGRELMAGIKLSIPIVRGSLIVKYEKL